MRSVHWQRIEGGLLGLAGLAIAIYAQPGWPWWLWLVMLLWPDLSMAGYAAGNRVGAFVYNAFHLYAWGPLLMLAGLAMGGGTAVIAAGALWLAHVGIDRALGYGLKLPGGFRDTHLGWIGGPGQGPGRP